jgi:hypothetical protein
MLDSVLIQRIRAIFLHHEARVTVGEAAGMIGWSRGEMDAAVANGEIEVVGTGSGTRIELRELAEVAVQRWPLVTIEEALGCDAASILPAGLRTRKFTVRLPRYQIGALEVLAEDGREPVEVMLMRMFEELTDLHHERLARVIPGLGEAMAWPGDSAGWHRLGLPILRDGADRSAD